VREDRAGLITHVMVTIEVAGVLTEFTGGARTIPVGGQPRTVADALALLWSRHPALRDRVVTERGQIRPHVALFVNADHIRHRHDVETPLADGDEITILPAISGGEGPAAPGGKP
jgi:molybdopterin synthase sulfur carrier subunit